VLKVLITSAPFCTKSVHFTLSPEGKYVLLSWSLLLYTKKATDETAYELYAIWWSKMGLTHSSFFLKACLFLSHYHAKFVGLVNNRLLEVIKWQQFIKSCVHLSRCYTICISPLLLSNYNPCLSLFQQHNSVQTPHTLCIVTTCFGVQWPSSGTYSFLHSLFTHMSAISPYNGQCLHIGSMLFGYIVFVLPLCYKMFCCSCSLVSRVVRFLVVFTNVAAGCSLLLLWDFLMILYWCSGCVFGLWVCGVRFCIPMAWPCVEIVCDACTSIRYTSAQELYNLGYRFNKPTCLWWVKYVSDEWNGLWVYFIIIIFQTYFCSFCLMFRWLWSFLHTLT
jgi:hypothetical protein